jgi:hypothetical protein
MIMNAKAMVLSDHENSISGSKGLKLQLLTELPPSAQH